MKKSTLFKAMMAVSGAVVASIPVIYAYEYDPNGTPTTAEEAKATLVGTPNTVWTWRPTPVCSGGVWGNGGYHGDSSIEPSKTLASAWWGCGTIDSNGEYTFADHMEYSAFDYATGEEYSGSYMVFGEDGSLLKYSADGLLLNVGRFDVSDWHSGGLYDFRLGYLDTSAGAILWPYMINSTDHYQPTKFEVAYLTASDLLLVYAPEGTGSWGECTWWSFQSMEKEPQGGQMTYQTAFSALVGAGDKVWTWGPTNINGGAVWGNGGYRGENLTTPGEIPIAWWGCGTQDSSCPQIFSGELHHSAVGKLTGEEYSDSYMVFGKDGSLKKYDRQGMLLNRGTFNISGWFDGEYIDCKMGDLDTSAGAILWPFQINGGGYQPTKFEIGYLSPSDLVLIYGPGDRGAWSECTWWSFKAIAQEVPDTYVSKESAMESLVGTTHTVWTWNPTPTNGGAVWGNGVYHAAPVKDITNGYPGAWWGCGQVDGICSETFADCLKITTTDSLTGDEYSGSYMVFGRDGSLKKYDKDGNLLNSGEFKISDWFDGEYMDYRMGDLDTSAGAILWPFRNDGSGFQPEKFEIAYLSPSDLMLVYAPEGTGSWGVCTWWSFKSVIKSTNSRDNAIAALVGNEKTAWTWSPTLVNGGAVWGNGGYQAGLTTDPISGYPGAWWGCGTIDGDCADTFASQMAHSVNIQPIGEEYSGSYMVFGKDGSLNKYDPNGKLLNSGRFNVSNWFGDEPEEYRLGDLETSAGAILWPFMINSYEYYQPTKFEIAYLSGSNLLLTYAQEGQGSWGECTWWSFKSVEKDIDSAVSINADKGIQVQCSDGVMYITSDKARTVAIHDITGRLIKSVKVEAGKNPVKGLSRGIYLVNATKVKL